MMVLISHVLRSSSVETGCLCPEYLKCNLLLKLEGQGRKISYSGSLPVTTVRKFICKVLVCVRVLGLAAQGRAFLLQL
jgi:hypothetical protein